MICTKSVRHSLLLHRHVGDNTRFTGIGSMVFGQKHERNTSTHIYTSTTDTKKRTSTENDGEVRLPSHTSRMRTRMRRLHGLDHIEHTDEHTNGNGKGTMHQPHHYVTTEEEGSSLEKLDQIEPQLFIHQQNSVKATDTFSKFLKKQVDKRSMEQVIEMHFGTVRFDGSSQQRRRINQQIIDNAQADVHYENAEVCQNAKTSQKQEQSSGEFGSYGEGVPANLFDDHYFGSLTDTGTPSPKVSNTPSDQKETQNEIPNYKAESVHYCASENKDVSVPESNLTSNSVGLHSSNMAKTENMFDEQYFEDVDSEKMQKCDVKKMKANQLKDNLFAPSDMNMMKPSVNIFDEQYFEGCPPKTLPSDNDTCSGTYSDNSSENKYEESETSTISEKEGISKVNHENKHKKAEHFVEDWNREDPDSNMPNGLMSVTEPGDNIAKHSNEMVEQHGEKETSDTLHIMNTTKQQIREKTRPRANTDNPQTAYDLAMKIRQEKRGRDVDPKTSADYSLVPRKAKWTGQKDSRGFRILTNQVLDLQEMPQDVVVSILKDSILYEDDNVIAIDKPYGLPSHGGPGVHHSVGQLLDKLALRLKPVSSDSSTSLQLVHRLDKQTTGVMLLARDHQAQQILHDMFKRREVIKKYWLLTKGIPDPLEGVIDIPMAVGTVGDNHRMTLRPNYPKESRLMHKTTPEGRCLEAITNYKVLDSNNMAALVECQPESGIKHQIRCHMAFALNTPILGDHKYSHYSKLAPQKLHPEILRCLGVRQAKVRHLAMHLHAQQLILPNFKDGRNLFISARLPRHFVQNMKWLGIKPPKG